MLLPTSSLKALVAVLSLCSVTVNGHMMMGSPIPYGKSTLNNSPLAADGSDFPCKQRTGVYNAEGASNVMAIGTPQTLSFIGSAVHGGGSCQVSLTTDLQPTKSSKWMVIKSIEGGCPADVTGNLPANAAGTDAATFQYTVPTGISPGEYTIAWSWVNKIGNREFYMNCGPATVTAAKKKRYAPAPQTPAKRDTTFPEMFVANLAGVSNGCATTEGDDILYPDPGQDVQKSSDGHFNPPTGCGATPPEVADNGATAPAPTSAGGAGSAQTSAPAAASTGSPGVFASGAAGSSAAPVATSTAVVSPLPAATSAAASGASAPPATASGATTVAGTQSGPCTPEGAWSCAADGLSFQRCASGVWSVPMAMAAGTTCTPGISAVFNMSADKARRRDSRVRRSHRVLFDS